MATNQYTIQQGNTLGGLATQFGTTVQGLQALNPQITNPNLIITGQQLNLPGSTMPMQNGTPIINSNTLNTGTPPPIMPPQQPPATTPQQYVQGLPPLLQLAPVGAGVRAQEASLSAAQRRLLQYQNALTGKSAEQLRLEQQQGISGINQELQGLNEQYANKQSGFMQAAENYRSGGVLSQELSTGKQAQIERNKAVELGGLGIQIMAKQGKLDAAHSEVDRVLALEFDPIKQEIENTKTFIDMNYQNLSRADKKLADQVKMQNDRDMKALDFLYDIKKSAYDKIIKDGGGSDQIKLLTDAKSVEDVVKAFGTSIVADATPTLANGKPDVVSELANTLRLSGKDVPQASAALSVLTNIQKLASANPKGEFVGLGRSRSLINLRGGEKRVQFISNKSDLAALKGTVSKWLSGLTLSKQQEKDILNIVPNESDTKFQIQTKLNSLAEFMQGQAKSELATKGVNYNPTRIDYFSNPIDNYVDNAVEQATDPYEQYLIQINQTP